MVGSKVCKVQFIPTLSSRNKFLGAFSTRMRPVTICRPAKESEKPKETTTESSLHPSASASTNPVQSKNCTMKFIKLYLTSYSPMLVRVCIPKENTIGSTVTTEGPKIQTTTAFPSNINESSTERFDYLIRH